MKKSILNRLRPVLCLILKNFYLPEVFNSRHFRDTSKGFRWAIQALIYRNLLRLGPTHKVPVGPRTFVSNIDNLVFDYDDLRNLQSPGVYLQNISAKITIGSGTYIGPNVGIITSNHNPRNLAQHMNAKPVTIGKNCWIGMNSVILPGVTLADGTTVGAGCVVTKSVVTPNQILVGQAAEIKKKN